MLVGLIKAVLQYWI